MRFLPSGLIVAIALMAGGFPALAETPASPKDDLSRIEK
jgi:hypothetical protein